MDWREARRLRAWELHQLGWTQRRIAAELGVTQGAVSQWIHRALAGGGVDALLRKPSPGRRTALTQAQLAQLPVLIAKGPTAFGLRGHRWSIARVVTVIRQVFGVSYHPAHVSRLLRTHSPGWRDHRFG